jgi:pimeloyl-ACP methyl ester carboxylesterase
MPEVFVDTVRLYYQVEGQGDPLLFIHGLGSSHRDWQQQVDYFVAKYRVMTLDLRGHGQSDKPRGRYSIEQFATDVARLIELPGHGPAHIVGLSLGGTVAFELAATRPELVRSLTVVNSGPEMPRGRWRDRLKVWFMLFVRTLIVRLRGMRQLGETLAGRLLPEPSQSELRRIFVQRWSENDPRAYLASMWALRRWSVADRLSDIRCPTLIVAADMDYTPLAYKQAYAAKLPRADVVCIPHSRHVTPIDQPEAFNHQLERFLSAAQGMNSTTANTETPEARRPS